MLKCASESQEKDQPVLQEQFLVFKDKLVAALPLLQVSLRIFVTFLDLLLIFRINMKMMKKSQFVGV